MAITLLIVFYIHLHIVLTSEFTQKFPYVQFVKVGENATITCNKTDFNSYDSWQWYKEKEDGGLQDVARSTCANPRSSSHRILSMCDQKKLAMEIQNVARSDSGVYYCSDPGLDQKFYMANTLIVTEPEPEDPTISILTSVAEHNADPDTMVLLCIALNWSNNWTLIKWSIAGEEQDGWLTLDPDGSLRNLIFLPVSSKEKEVICYLKNLHDGRNISESLSSELLDDDQNDKSRCYIVLYVGLGIAALLLVIHQIILAKRRGCLCKERPKEHKRTERAVRFRPEEEMVVYAPVKG